MPALIGFGILRPCERVVRSAGDGGTGVRLCRAGNGILHERSAFWSRNHFIFIGYRLCLYFDLRRGFDNGIRSLFLRRGESIGGDDLGRDGSRYGAPGTACRDIGKRCTGGNYLLLDGGNGLLGGHVHACGLLLHRRRGQVWLGGTVAAEEYEDARQDGCGGCEADGSPPPPEGDDLPAIPAVELVAHSMPDPRRNFFLRVLKHPLQFEIEICILVVLHLTFCSLSCSAT